MKTKVSHSRSLAAPSRAALALPTVAALAMVLLLQLAAPRLHGQDSFNPVINGPVFSFLPEPGGTLMLAGNFYSNPPYNFLNALSRLDAAGLDTGTFLPRIPTTGPQAVAVLPDGTLLECGEFSALYDEQGQPVLSSFMRFSATGSLLPTYQIHYYVPVYALAPQADGKVLIGGNFTGLDSAPRTMLARYLPTGALDGTFAPEANDLVFTVALQPDGQILAGGMFTSLGGQVRNRIGRLSSTGALDTGFNPNANGTVVCLLV